MKTRSILASLVALMLCACATESELIDYQPNSQHKHIRSVNRVKVKSPQTILFAGDSIMAGLGPVLEKNLAKDETLQFIQGGVVSSGLSNTRFYNWPERMQQYLSENSPSLVIICIGTNDSKPIIEDGKTLRYGSDQWIASYNKRIENMLDNILASGAQIIWISPPIMGRENLENELVLIRDIMSKACKQRGIPYINIQPTLADAFGQYQRYVLVDNKQVLLRAKDGIHIANAGNALIANQVLPEITKIIIETEKRVQ